MNFLTSIKRHPIMTYYVLVFAISWGYMLTTIGPGEFLGTNPLSQTQFMYLVLLAPILGPGVASILSTVVIYGRAGLRDLVSRLCKWRVNGRWYAVALLTSPLLTAAIVFAFSQDPSIMTASYNGGLLLPGIAVGLFVPFFEELGWTGFAIPQLRKHYGILATGLIVGLLWGAWHFPLFSGEARSSAVPPVLFLAVLLFSWLPPYRVLMVWIYDRTKSILIPILMHLPIVVTGLVVSEMPVLTYDIAFATSLWAVVLGVLLLAKKAQPQLTGTSPSAQLIEETVEASAR